MAEQTVEQRERSLAEGVGRIRNGFMDDLNYRVSNEMLKPLQRQMKMVTRRPKQ